MNLRIQHIAIAAFTLGMTACSTMQMGSSEAKTEATGSAGGSQSQNASSKLERCDASLGTIALVEDTNAPWYGILTGQYRLGSTSPVLKLMIQQSNCFVVVERGRAMNNMMQERALMDSGELRQTLAQRVASRDVLLDGRLGGLADLGDPGRDPVFGYGKPRFDRDCR